MYELQKHHCIAWVLYCGMNIIVETCNEIKSLDFRIFGQHIVAAIFREFIYTNFKIK